MTLLVGAPQGTPTPEKPPKRSPFGRIVADQRTGLLVLVVVFASLRSTFLDAQFVVFPLLRDVATLTVVVLAHCLSGLLIGIAAVITLASAPGVNQSIGGDWLLASFAARAQFSLNPSWVNFVVGGVVLGTVVLTHRRTSRGAAA